MKQLAWAVTLALVLAACSSSAASKSKPKAAAPAACNMIVVKPTVTKVAGVAHDYTLTSSLDGARIRFHWFPIAKKAPVVLMGPGWGEAGAEDTGGTGLFGDSPVASLKKAGYHVLTWDPRGFGKSTGTITIDAPDKEAHDVSELITWLSGQPNVLSDGGDPRVGMVGGSYGGGIQFTTAANDCRIDTIVPTIAWHSLTTSLDKNNTPKSGWGDLLYAAAPEKNLDPHIKKAEKDSHEFGTQDAATLAWFASRGPGDALMNKIKIPTLIIQGTVDTLFTLDEAVSNYTILHNNNVPVAMMWFCGGHGVCLTKSDPVARRTDATMKWLQRWLMRDTSVDTGPAISIIDQNAKAYTAANYPLPAGTPISADGSGTLSLQAAGGSGGAKIPASAGVIGTVASSFTPARATNAVNVPIKTPSAAMAVGAPTLKLTYSGSSPTHSKPTRVFAQLVDDKTGLVLGNQITPIEVTLDGKSHTTTTPLEMVSFATTPGGSLTLQLVATTGAYAVPALGGKITFSAIHIDVPTVTGLRAGS